MKIYRICFIAIFLIIIAFPLVGLLWYEEPAGTENKELAKLPVVYEDGINVEFFTELKDYFNDHFAYRQELVTVNSIIKAEVFNESSEDLAIVGRDDWLFLKVTLEDYQGTNIVSSRGINNMVKTLSLMQEYVNGLGGSFVFTIAPNKNTLYPEYMPYYYKVINDESNMDLITPRLGDVGINYYDAKAAFLSQEDILYHTGDSHWDNRGAAMVQDGILDKAGVEHTDYTELDYAVYDDFRGDIDKILYPQAGNTEMEYDYSSYMSYEYITKQDENAQVSIVEESTVETVNEAADGRLLCFRDSFGNSLLPFMANEFNYSYFSKSIPYRLDYMYQLSMNVCVVELVERNLIQLVRFAPVMPAPLRGFDATCEEYVSETTVFDASNYEDYYKFTGKVDSVYVSETSFIYIRLTNQDGACYVIEATPAYDYLGYGADSDYGFTAYIGKYALPTGIYEVEIITENGVYYKTACDTRIEF